MWNVVQSQKDADDLMNVFGGFHDGCIKEMKYTSEEYVDENLSMAFHTVSELRVIFQRQFKNPCALEAVFSNLIGMNLPHCFERYDGIIYGASIVVDDEGITWVNYYGFESDNLSTVLKQEDRIWIKAKEMKWRAADEYIGDKEVYINRL